MFFLFLSFCRLDLIKFTFYNELCSVRKQDRRQPVGFGEDFESYLIRDPLIHRKPAYNYRAYGYARTEP